jgi:hypothetical protein
MLSVSDYVLLPDGRLVRAPLWAGLVQLHDRGIVVHVDGDDLIVRPRARLTSEDREWLRCHKGDVLALLQPASSAPLPPDWHEHVVFAATVDELCAALDTEHRAGRCRVCHRLLTNSGTGPCSRCRRRRSTTKEREPS